MDPGRRVVGIQRQRLADQAYEILRARILERELQPGQRLSVPQLAGELGLSRSPVREAVQRLVAEGLGVEQVHRGAVVAGFGADEVDEMYELRAVLEGLSARRAAARVAPGLVSDLTALLTDHSKAIKFGSEPDIVRADLRFHSRILEAADSLHLSRALTPIIGRANLAMLAGDLRAWPKEAVREHRRVLQAIKAGDESAAEESARLHIELVQQRLRRRLGEEKD
jgi:DNA-binding GntR family transcriptional regulator